ncbi:MAG: hypothetical protein PHI70_10330, partial [Proteiniphilum sp.]|nr:hypothetical protein [Proteiniphilum sp.]MDD4417165.1 hypothetical protein [Proteiniphilum sp.]
LDCQFDVYGLYQIWLEEKQYPRFADLDEHYMQFSVIDLQFSVTLYKGNQLLIPCLKNGGM